jgi:glycosyltransferase involved in cell wall biosynthesis
MPQSVEIEKEKTRLGIGLDSKVVGTVGKLREEKGIEYFIRAAHIVLQKYPQTTFLVVGDGPLRQNLEKLAKQLKVENNILFTGYRQNVPVILSLFDIDVMPSLTEGSPLALLEAMAMGRPIIATDVGGIKEILEDKKTGLLVQPRDSSALAQGILHLFENQEIAEKLGMRAREDSNKYDIQLYIKRLQNLYSQVAASR